MGFIGSKLSKKLEKLGHKVVGIDLQEGNDINNPKTIFPFDVDIVYHLAAQTSVMESMDNPLLDAIQNIMGTLKIAQLYPSTRIIYTTTVAGIEPESPYGISKLTGEKYIKMLCGNYVICRLPNVYDKTGKSIIAKILNESKITFYGSGLRDYVHVDDIVEGLIKAILWRTDSYTFGGDDKINLEKLAKIAQKKGIDVLIGPQRKGEKIISVGINSTPDWHPKIKLESILK